MAISVRWYFVTLYTVGVVELLMFGAWCNTPVFRGYDMPAGNFGS